MSVFVRNHVWNDWSSGTTVTRSSYNSESGVVRSDSILVVVVTWEDTTSLPTISDVTFNSVSLTNADGTTNSTVGCEIWYQTNPSGTADVVVTFSSAPDSARVSTFVLDGAVEQAPEVTNTNTSTSSTTISTSVTTVTGGAFIVDGVVSNNTTGTQDAGQSWNEPPAQVGHFHGASWKAGGDAGSHSMGWTGFAAGSDNAQTVVAFEDAGGWVSNFVSALTQGNEDANAVTNAAQITQVTTPVPPSPADDWDYVWQFTGNASQGGLSFPRDAGNITGPTSNYIIISKYFRWTDLSPGSEYTFLAAQQNIGALGGNIAFELRLQTDGDLVLRDDAAGIVATATTPFTVNTYHRIEVRLLPGQSGTGRCQVWVDGTDIFSGEQSGDFETNYSFCSQIVIQGPPASSGNMFCTGGPFHINSTAASDRLDSDFEIIGPYQDTAITGATPDVSGDATVHDLDGDGTNWATTQEIPFSDETADTDAAEYAGTPLEGGIFTDGGTRSGPASDSRIDGTSNIKAWKGLWRLERGTGGGTTHTVYLGDDGISDLTGADSATATVGAAAGNYYFVTDDSTNMPTSTDNFCIGAGLVGARNLYIHEMAAFVLHVPSAVIADDEDAWLFTPGSHQPVIKPDDIVSY